MSGGVPPSSRAGKSRRSIKNQADRVADLLERFKGHDAEVIGKLNITVPDALGVIGECDGVLYTTQRDGKIERYIHEFAKKDKPLLCVSPDGRQLYIVEGAFVFTERGIVDMSDTKNLPKELRE